METPYSQFAIVNENDEVNNSELFTLARFPLRRPKMLPKQKTRMNDIVFCYFRRARKGGEIAVVVMGFCYVFFSVIMFINIDYVFIL